MQKNGVPVKLAQLGLAFNRESNSDVKFGPNYEAFAQNRGVITVLQHFDFCTTCI